MSQQIDEIFIKYENIFLGKQEEMRAFLLKYFEDDFRRHWVEKIERIDMTEKIKTSGFRKNISSWRNSNNDIILSTCLVVDGTQKRYDYKISFYKEKFHSDDIEIIEKALIEISNLRENLHFKVALLKLESTIKIAQEKEIPEYIKKIKDIKKDIIAAMEEYNKMIDNLSEKIRINQENNDLEEVLNNCEKIIQISESLNRDDLIKKYSLLTDQIMKEMISNKGNRDTKLKELAELEKIFVINQENGNFEEAIINCKKIIQISKSISRDDLKKKYLFILDQLNIDKIAENKRYKKLKEELKELDEKIKFNLDKNYLDVALTNCEKSIQISENIKDNDLLKKYSFILEEIKKKIIDVEEK